MRHSIFKGVGMASQTTHGHMASSQPNPKAEGRLLLDADGALRAVAFGAAHGEAELGGLELLATGHEPPR